MTRYKATIAYDGTDFAGFQSQTNQRTVQKEIEKILTKLNSFEPVILQGSGRTDSGVHAFGQVIHFDLKGKVRDLERLRFGLDTQTPADIAVKKVELVPDDWHARYQKHEKTYEYYLENSITRSPFQRHSKAYFRYPLNFERMQEAMSKLVGEHDFTGFTASGSSVDDKVRRFIRQKLSVLTKKISNLFFVAMAFCINKCETWLEQSLKLVMTECLSAK